MKNKLWFVVSSLLIISLSIAACTSNAPATVPTRVPIAAILPTEAPTEPAVSFPTGKFVKSGTQNYGLIFNEDKTFSVFSGDTTFVHGAYKVEGNVFTETSNNGGCKTYVSFHYTFDGKNLTFTYVGNPDDDLACDGRHADFNNVTYTLSK